jgi:hypothetical protein|eukprot:SAG25_NODE_1927_length_2139_cov_2.169608_2_plen_43_part_00
MQAELRLRRQQAAKAFGVKRRQLKENAVRDIEAVSTYPLALP